jgi:hypothetical protein
MDGWMLLSSMGFGLLCLITIFNRYHLTPMQAIAGREITIANHPSFSKLESPSVTAVANVLPTGSGICRWWQVC